MMASMSRRGFVAGAAQAALVAGGAALAHADEAASAQGGASVSRAAPRWSFESPMGPVDESQIKASIDTELAIIGAGQSGSLAALTAASLGAGAVVIQENPTVFTHGWANHVVNPSYAQEAEDEDALISAFYNSGAGWADIRLLKLLVRESGETYDFINSVAEELGLEARYVMASGNISVWSDGTAYHRQNTMITQTQPYAEQRGVRYLFSHRGLYLEKDADGRVSGIVAEDLDEGGYVRVNASRGVIVATGDIGGDREMLERYAPFAVDVPSAYVGGTNRGDGHKMMLWAGAKMQSFPYACGIHYDPTTLSEGNAPYSYYPWLCVNKNGERFMNEASEYQTKVYSACCQSDPHVFDIGGPQMRDFISAGPDVRGFTWDDAYERGAIVEGATLDDLANKIGVPAEALRATVERYMALYESGEDADFMKPIESFANTLLDEDGPFFAIQRVPGTLCTLGGVCVDERLRAVGQDDKPIEGLYAVGNTQGRVFGLWYDTSVMAGTSTVRACTMGRLAARFALGDL